ERVDGQQQQRVSQRPQEPERGTLVFDVQVLADQPREQLPPDPALDASALGGGQADHAPPRSATARLRASSAPCCAAMLTRPPPRSIADWSKVTGRERTQQTG